MESVRRTAVAGTFYSDDADAPRRNVRSLLAAVQPTSGPPPKAVIAPHAGHMYSGPIAASAYAPWVPLRDAIRRVVLIGPSHRVALRGVALCSASEYDTPLGSVPIAADAIEVLRALPQVAILDDAHRWEHSLEVHLPFLIECLGEFELVPLVAGDARGEEVAQVLDTVWGGDETVIVVSSDLSHYHDYDTARAHDRRTSDAILALQPEVIGSEQACGCVPIAGLLTAAQRRGLHPTLLDLRNSGDTAGPRDRVVGYGAYAFA